MPTLETTLAWSCGLTTIAMAWTFSLAYLFVIYCVIVSEYQLIEENGNDIQIRTVRFSSD